ncbi:CoA-binding protein [Candidatus Pacearchaeota archaeon]|nr:CoA-binding protein [Candidatus Pacearchaeota archaeon]
MGDSKTFFNAKSIAIIGASRNPTKVGHTIFKNLLKSNKKIFPVNPKTEKILNHKSYNDLFEIPYQIDCIVIAIPAKLVPQTLRQAGKRKIKSAIIISAGFSEIGNTKLEQQIKQIAKEENITILGPNSYGLIDPHQKLNTTYFQGDIEPGQIAFISQSGAIGSAILDSQQKLSGFVSIGNSAQLDFSDFIEYYSKDSQTKVITIYLESLKKEKGRNFIETCRKCKKPIIVLKSGKSQAGQKAAQSHTAALASELGIYNGILKQAKCIQVDSIKQLFQLANILTKYPKLKNSTAIITNAGGLGVLTTDYCEKNNIKIPQLKKSTIEKLNKTLPQNWSHNNPIDLVGTALAKDYETTLKIIEKENFDFIIALLTPQQMTQSLLTSKTLAKSKKPIFTCFLGNTQIKKAKEFMNKSEMINFDEPKEMCDTIGKIFNQS